MKKEIKKEREDQYQYQDQDQKKTDSERSTTVKNSSIFSFFTIISRGLGLLRDMLKAHAFGTGIASVAFDIAFRLPNMLRNLVAEGALSQAFVPIYQEYRDENDSQKERKAFGNVLGVVLVLLGIFTLVIVFLMPYLLPFLIKQNNGSQQITNLSVNLAQLLFPYILLMSLASLYMSVQYSYKRFAAASFGPALLNTVILIFFSAYYFFVYPWQMANPNVNNTSQYQNYPIYVFSFVTLLAAFVQLSFQAYTVKKMGLSPIVKVNFKHPVVKKLFVMMLPAVFGASVQEIGQLIDIALATRLYDKIPEAVSALTYSHRLIQLPIGIFGVAVATASLPQLSQIFLSGNKEKFSESLFDSAQLNLFLLLPATLGLMFFAEPVIGLLFEHGEFTRRSTQVTAVATIYYAPGIVAFGLQKLFMNSLYARRNSKTPALITFFTLITNVLLSLYFMQSLLHAGLALSSSLAAFFSVAMYFIVYVRSGMISLEKNFLRTRFVSAGKIILVNVIFALILWTVTSQIKSHSYFLQVLAIVPFIFFYVFLAFVFRVQEWFLFAQMLKKLKDKLIG